MRETTLEIVKIGSKGATMKWKNPQSRNEGKISVVREFQEEGVACKEVREEIWAKKEKTHDFNLVFCRQADGEWVKRGDPVVNR
jgi:surface antigen